MLFWGYFTSLYVSQVSWGSPGFLADLEGACGCQSEEGSQFVVGMSEGLYCDVRHQNQGGPLALYIFH